MQNQEVKLIFETQCRLYISNVMILSMQVRFQVRHMVSWRDILGNSNEGKVTLQRGFAQRKRLSCSYEPCVGRKIKIEGESL